jgi:hypothetical protein
MPSKIEESTDEKLESSSGAAAMPFLLAWFRTFNFQLSTG